MTNIIPNTTPWTQLAVATGDRETLKRLKAGDRIEETVFVYFVPILGWKVEDDGAMTPLTPTPEEGGADYVGKQLWRYAVLALHNPETEQFYSIDDKQFCRIGELMRDVVLGLDYEESAREAAA
jgi:hypothetical protein